MRKKRKLQARTVTLREHREDQETPELLEAMAAAKIAEALEEASESVEEQIARVARTKLVVEGLLFASDKPLTVQRLKQLMGAKDSEGIEQALEALMHDYQNRGIVIHEVAGGYQFRTHPSTSEWVQQLIAGRPVRLSRAQLETMAIIAYRQPVTRPEIDEIRGVDSGGTLKLLLDRDLVRVLGKKEEVGRPLLYGTTKEFLNFFNLSALRDLPTLREYHELTEDSMRVVEEKLGVSAEEAQKTAHAAVEAAAVEAAAVEAAAVEARQAEEQQAAAINPADGADAVSSADAAVAPTVSASDLAAAAEALNPVCADSPSAEDTSTEVEEGGFEDAHGDTGVHDVSEDVTPVVVPEADDAETEVAVADDANDPNEVVAGSSGRSDDIHDGEPSARSNDSLAGEQDEPVSADATEIVAETETGDEAVSETAAEAIVDGPPPDGDTDPEASATL